MGSARTLTEMFLPEATLEFPDSEVAAVTRMIQSNERAGRIPRGATENWPIVQSGNGGGSKASKGKRPPLTNLPDSNLADLDAYVYDRAQGNITPSKAKPTTKPSVKARGPSPGASGDASGRGVPSQSSLRSDEPGDGTLSHKPPGGLKKYIGGGNGAKAIKGKDKPEPKASADPSRLKRLYSKARGKDPETDLPTPKSAATKVHGGGPSTRAHTFNDPDRKFVGQQPDDAPLFNVPGVTDQPDHDDSGDEKVAAVKQGLSGALPNVPRRSPPSFPEADIWDRFAGMTGHQDPAAPISKKQGRLSRLFKGRRDDNI